MDAVTHARGGGKCAFAACDGLGCGRGVPCMPGDTGRPVGVLLSGLEKGKGPTYAPVCGLPVTWRNERRWVLNAGV